MYPSYNLLSSNMHGFSEEGALECILSFIIPAHSLLCTLHAIPDLAYVEHESIQQGTYTQRGYICHMTSVQGPSLLLIELTGVEKGHKIPKISAASFELTFLLSLLTLWIAVTPNVKFTLMLSTYIIKLQQVVHRKNCEW